MNKTKMTLAVSGGVIALVVLVTAFFVWSAYCERTAAAEGDMEEGTDGLETVVAKAESLSRKPVYPCAASLKAIESNRTAVADWQAGALKLAARGDRTFAKTTSAAFKTFLVADARRLAALPGAVGGALMKPDFAFGPFTDYISGGKMPEDAQVAELQRKWDDLATVIEILAQNGVAELTDVQFKAKDEKGDEDKDKKAKRGNRGKRPSPRGVSAPPALDAHPFSYVISFTARPAAFVKAINALETCERFVTVDGFTFARTRDAIQEALGGDEKKAEAAAGRRGRRGRRGAAEENPAANENETAKKGLVTDPATDEPLAIVLNVTVSDFGSLEEKEEAK